MYMSKNVSVTVIVALLLVGCVLAASAGTIGSQRAQVHQAQVAATTAARQVEVAATMEAEKEKAAQIREAYEGQSTIIGAETDAYVQKRSVDMTFYALQKSEERQDEMLYFVLNGESKQKTEIRTWNLVGGLGFVVAVLVVVVMVVLGNWTQIAGIVVALRTIVQTDR
ncbi:MAG: hypothetical protein JXA89_28250 [Anaerolineae bacterium]|nr:hypothetical protein [Anaerolineae bacterium]